MLGVETTAENKAGLPGAKAILRYTSGGSGGLHASPHQRGGWCTVAP
jgi:hypothetical protein